MTDDGKRRLKTEREREFETLVHRFDVVTNIFVMFLLIIFTMCFFFFFLFLFFREWGFSLPYLSPYRPLFLSKFQ